MLIQNEKWQGNDEKGEPSEIPNYDPVRKQMYALIFYGFLLVKSPEDWLANPVLICQPYSIERGAFKCCCDYNIQSYTTDKKGICWREWTPYICTIYACIITYTAVSSRRNKAINIHIYTIKVLYVYGSNHLVTQHQ